MTSSKLSCKYPSITNFSKVNMQKQVQGRRN
jgi:hypothetical protein